MPLKSLTQRNGLMLKSKGGSIGGTCLSVNTKLKKDCLTEWKSLPVKLRRELEDIELYVRMQVLNPRASFIIQRNVGEEDFMSWLENLVEFDFTEVDGE